jgi:hypothetical protein
MDEILSRLYEQLMDGATGAAIPSRNRERAEVYMIGILNKIIQHARQHECDEIARLAQEAKESGNAETLIDLLRQILQ